MKRLRNKIEDLKTGADFQFILLKQAKRDLEEMRTRNPIADEIKLIKQRHSN